MTNVLPQSRLQELSREARAKFMLTGSLVLATAAVAGIVALAPAFFVVYFSRAANSGELNAALDTETQRREDQQAAARTRVLLQEVSMLEKRETPASEAIAAAYALKPSGVTVGGVAYTKGDSGTITLVGVAKSRDEVSLYRDALSKDKRFATVSVPVSALVGALEGTFTITLTGRF